MSGKRLKVAFVVQRCGTEITGGAEMLCLQVALRMSAYWEVEILTTCALDYMTWADHYAAGEETSGGVVIRRFGVDFPRNVDAFNRLSERIRPRLSLLTLDEQEEWMRSQGPMSSGLSGFIRSRKDEYDTFIFVGYLYGTTYFNLPVVADKAWLLSCAHDEWPIWMSCWDEFFRMPKGFIFNTLEERDFVRRRFSGRLFDGPVIGVGVDIPVDVDPSRFRRRFKIDTPFVLYAGRIDPSKGCDTLFDFFVRFSARSGYEMKLVLIGKAVMPVPDHPAIISLGFVDERVKFDAMAACEWLLNPSPHESLSIVLLETWSVRRPVLVTARSEVLVGQCRRANAGLWFEGFEEFSTVLETVGNDVKSVLGANGRTFVESNYSWPLITKKILEICV